MNDYLVCINVNDPDGVQSIDREDRDNVLEIIGLTQNFLLDDLDKSLVLPNCPNNTEQK